jgi:hypothetical protein
MVTMEVFPDFGIWDDTPDFREWMIFYLGRHPDSGMGEKIKSL